MLEKIIITTQNEIRTRVTLIRDRNDIEKKHVEFHQYFIDFESRINLELSTLSQCQFFQVDSPFIIDEISPNF